MSHSSFDDWATGPVARVEAKTIGPIDVDCKGWQADTPAADWCTGRLERVCQSLPPNAVVDPMGDPALASHLEDLRGRAEELQQTNGAAHKQAARKTCDLSGAIFFRFPHIATVKPLARKVAQLFRAAAGNIKPIDEEVRLYQAYILIRASDLETRPTD